jgi:AcrR family transcriptional regulator
MPRPRAHVDTARLVDAFAADGLHGTSSSALARAVDLAKPTLYAHGVSKEALFLHAVQAEVERVLARLAAAAERTPAGRSARRRALVTAEALLEHAAVRPAGARLLAHTARHSSSGVADPVAAALRRVPDYVEAGLRRDLAADGLDASLAPWLARSVVAAAWAMAEPRKGERRPARRALAELVAAVVPAPPPPDGGSWPVA